MRLIALHKENSAHFAPNRLFIVNSAHFAPNQLYRGKNSAHFAPNTQPIKRILSVKEISETRIAQIPFLNSKSLTFLLTFLKLRFKKVRKI